MMLKLKSSLLLIFLSAIFFSCEKEYSLEGNILGGTAVFTFTGAPGSCTNSVVTGTYQPGIALDSTNIATLSVDVTAVGTYTISTNTANGISFVGSGAFTTIGTQQVSLIGSGTLTTGSTGSLTFTPTDGCAFSIVVSGGGGSSGGTSVFTYDGTPGTCTSATPGAASFVAGTPLTTANTITISVLVTTVGTYSITTPAVNGFSFAGSGNFTALGAQSVTLTGTGTPITDGVFDFVPSNKGCAFALTVTAGTGLTDSLICTIDGVKRTFNVSLAGSTSDPTTFDISGNETTASNTPFFLISLTHASAIIADTYIRASPTNISTFCLVGYNDGTSSSTWGVGLLAQPKDFTVIVTSFTANRIEGTFEGTLYDSDGQGTTEKAVTLGKFSIGY